MEEKVLTSVRPSAAILLPHILLMFVIIGFFTIWKALINFFTTKLTITTKRIEGKRGLINTSKMNAPLKHITSVDISQSMWGKVFNYGTVKINTACGSYVFTYIPHPNGIEEIISMTLAENQ